MGDWKRHPVPEEEEGIVERSEGRTAWGDRTAADLSSLLVELSRALKGLRYYEEDHPAHRDVLDRAFLAWRVELERSGPIALHLDEGGFRADGVDQAVATTHLHELAAAFGEHSVATLRITPELTRQAFHELLGLLVLDDRVLARRGGLAAALARDPAPGVELRAVSDDPNESTQPMAVGGQTPPRAAGIAASAAPDEEGQDAGVDIEAELERLAGRADASAPRTSRPGASLGSALFSGDPIPLEDVPAGAQVAEEEDDGGTALDIDETPLPAVLAGGFEDFTKPMLEDDPLSAPATSAEDEKLRRLLVELDTCADDHAYVTSADSVLAQAVRLADHGHRDVAYRAVLVLADHAVGLGGRSGLQALAAQERLEALCEGPRLGEVMDRACDPEGRVAVRAAQVLLQIGGRTIGPLIDRLVSEPDPSRTGQIRSILIALGERSVPVLVAFARGDDPRRARVAVRLAGEIQSSHLVPTLIGLADGEAPELRRDAMRSLARIGGPKAMAALHRALSSARPGVAETAAACLGELGHRRSAAPLMARLDDAVQRGECELARTIVVALGALGAVEAIPKLVSLLERRPLWRRSAARDLRIPAIQALARLPGRESHRALERAARSRDAAVQSAARRALASPPRGGAREGGHDR